MRIEDYALIGDLHTAALVSRAGTIDWLCVPHFDSAACFAALLGTAQQGYWKLGPAENVKAVRRRYRPGTLILETEFDTASGTVCVVDFMPAPTEPQRAILRIAECRRGRVRLVMEAKVCTDYGIVSCSPEPNGEGFHFRAGKAHLILESFPRIQAVAGELVTGAFELACGETVCATLSWSDEGAAHKPFDPIRGAEQLERTEAWWRRWIARYQEKTRWHDAIVRSLCTLKALSYLPSGAVVAAPTTSLPERIGGVRNWDYRHCWLRDATFILRTFLECGFASEAGAWREWLLRVAGKKGALQTVYSIVGNPNIDERELEMLPGYEGSRPVRLGNDACRQFQLDIYGEITNALQTARSEDMAPDQTVWRLQKALLDQLESRWREPDNGIWEMRGPPRHFTHSKVMAWVGFMCAAEAVDRSGCDERAFRWRSLAKEIHNEVCDRAYDSNRNSFVQYYGAPEPDGSLLLLPLVGFLPATDPRMLGTVRALEQRLLHNGFLYRYAHSRDLDPLPEGEGAFLPCSFWLADNYALQGRREEAERLFERLLGVTNDVGLLAEEYDPIAERFLGNFPQAFSHVALIGTAHHLANAALRGSAGRAGTNAKSSR